MKEYVKEFTDVEKLEYIEDGVNAARLLTVVARTPAADTLSDEEYQNAVEWIFDKLTDDLHTLQEKMIADGCKALDA